MPITVSGLDKVRNEFEKIIKKIDSPEVMRRLGMFIITTVRERTRGTGRGVGRPGGNPSRLKAVTLPYAIWRAKQLRHPQAASGRSSNLTFSGRMLDGMIVKQATKSSLFIGFKRQADSDKAEYQEKQGRRFLVLSGKEIRDAAAFVKLQLSKR